MNKVIKYDSGLRLTVTPMNTTKALSIGVFVGTGSINETEKNNGISHFIEHMLFKGTNKRSAFDIANEMESIGASINAFTSKNVTAYYTVSTDEYARECLDILSDIFFNATFKEEHMDKEKSVVYEEINMTQDDGEDLCFDLLTKAHFKDSPLSQPILGTIDTVKAIDRQMILDYMAEYYTAENTVIVIVGNIEVNEAKKLVDEYFNRFIKKTGFKIKEWERVQLVSEYICRVKPLEQSNIGISFPCIEKKHPKEKALQLLTSVVGGGMSSRLFQEIREKLGFVYSIYNMPLQYKNDGAFIIFLATNPSYVEEAMKAIKRVLDELKEQGITEKEFSKGKAQLKSKTVIGAESSSAIMRANGINMTLFNKPFDVDDELNEINKTTLVDVNKMIKTIFDLDKASVSYVGKEIDLDMIATLQR